jgi:hypothetical protein
MDLPTCNYYLSGVLESQPQVGVVATAVAGPPVTLGLRDPVGLMVLENVLKEPQMLHCRHKWLLAVHANVAASTRDHSGRSLVSG